MKTEKLSRLTLKELKNINKSFSHGKKKLKIEALPPEGTPDPGTLVCEFTA